MFSNNNTAQKTENERKMSFDPLCNSSDELSQFCKSSQFLRDIELAMCECDSPESTTKNPKISENQNDISSEIITTNSIKFKQKSPDFSLSTDDFSDSFLKNSYNTQVHQNDLNDTPKKKFSLSLKKNNNTKENGINKAAEKSLIGSEVINSFGDEDPFLFKQPKVTPGKKAVLTEQFVSPKTIMNLINSDIKTQSNDKVSKASHLNVEQEVLNNIDLNCSISRLLDSSEYKKQVNAGFDNLETSIIHDRSINNEKNLEVTSNITINDLNWDESLGPSAVKIDTGKENTSFHEEFRELGPFYGLPDKVKHLIQQIKGIKELYGK